MFCFPGKAKVKVVGKGEIPMSALAVGDMVEAMSSTGALTNSKVEFFLHRDPQIVAPFLRLSTANGRVLVITQDHQLGVVDEDDGVLFMFAGDVQEGMNLVVPARNGHSLTRITSVTHETNTGIYAPCTTEGTIVVDGLGCSCYALGQHETIHRQMALVRRPLANFPTVAKHTCHGIVQCMKIPGVKRAIRASVGGHPRTVHVTCGPNGYLVTETRGNWCRKSRHTVAFSSSSSSGPHHFSSHEFNSPAGPTGNGLTMTMKDGIMTR